MVQTIILRIVMTLGLVVGAYLYGNSNGSHEATLKCAGEQASELNRIQGERDDLQGKLNESAREWAESKQRAEGNAARVVDGLRSDGIRLSVKLADQTIAAVEAHNRGVSDGRAELHAETAQALVRITVDADDQVKGLQDQLRILSGAQ